MHRSVTEISMSPSVVGAVADASPSKRAAVGRKVAVASTSLSDLPPTKKRTTTTTSDTLSEEKLRAERLQKESRLARTPVTIVRTAEDARRCLAILEAHPETVWACDTEVIDIDVKTQGPVGNGKVICVSIYGGDDVDFGTGSALWIENAGDAEGILQHFKAWFENPAYKKVWHNYGFDRHVMDNEGIRCRGFFGDTMHMARLWDSSRDKVAGGGGGEGYSLSSLTSSLFTDHPKAAFFVKTSMLELFGVAKRKKDGGESKKKELPDLLTLQTDPSSRDLWIEYSARDAVATWWLHDALVDRLTRMPWTVLHQPDAPLGTMFDFYQRYLRDFGELLTDMEAAGIKVDTQNHLRSAERAARDERQRMERLFIDWATEQCPAARDINIASTTQIQQLLFGHYEAFELVARQRAFEVDKTDDELQRAKDAALAQNPYVLRTAVELKDLCKERGLRSTAKRDELLAALVAYDADRDAAIAAFGTVAAKKALGLTNPAAAKPAAAKAPVVVNGEAYYKKLKLADLQALSEDRGLTAAVLAAVGKRPKKSDYVAALLAADAVQAAAANENAASATIDEPAATAAAVAEDAEAVATRLFFRLRDRHLRWLPSTPPTADVVEEILAAADRLQSERAARTTMLQLLATAAAAPYHFDTATTTPSTLLAQTIAVDVSRSPRFGRYVAYEAAPPPVEEAVVVTPALAEAEAAVAAAVEAAAAADASEPAPLGREVLKKRREFVIDTIGLEPVEFTTTGLPQVSAAVLKRLAGKNVFADDESETVWGAAFQFFGGGEAGKRACRAIGALAAVGQVDATINNFLVPLQALVDRHQRIHCSLNLNTETGRLSSRRPNLQNQPALEKDQYKIRDAFVAEAGQTFIVADYGQLELRILAHITNCASMIEAFRQGGCFHSRTAVGMYPYIAEAVAQNRVLLEWDYSKGQPTVPLVKDTFAAERRKAKTLNFSIAYGKTVHGLAADWGITKDEAEETLEAWYRDRPEVKAWQQKTQALARRHGYVTTMMGRYRRLPEATGDSGAARGHAMRAAINTPIQGSAADVVMMAMLKLWRSAELKRLGWRLLLQIHDEVILEGPKEHVDAAMREVRHCMENPFDDVGLAPLRVHLDVDAKSADSWYKAK